MNPAEQMVANVRGAVLMTASMAAFTVNDSFLKAMSDELPLFQAIAMRGIGATSVLLLIALITRQPIIAVPRGDRWRMTVRVLTEAGAAITFLAAVFHMEFANAAAINQVMPLVVALAAAIWLKERLTPIRIGAILVGFVGVLLIVQPGPDGFNWWSLSVIASVLMVTIRDLTTRQMSHSIPVMTMMIYGAAGVALIASIAAVLSEIRPVSLKALGQVSGSVTFLIMGYLTAILTMRSGDVSFVAPFRYTSMLFALVVGWVAFSEWPNGMTLTGAAIVIGAGIFSLASEMRPRRRV